MEIITYGLCGLIIIVTLISAIMMWKGIERLKKDLVQGESDFDKIDPNQALSDQGLENPVNYSLLEYKKTFLTAQNKTTTDAGEYIHSEVLLTKYLHFRLHLAVPNLMVGVGIFGTFLGLSVSFSGTSGGKQDTDAIMAMVTKLQDGMGTAFAASMVGMICSILHIALEKGLVNQTERSVAELTSRLNAKYLAPRMDELIGLTHAIYQLEANMQKEQQETRLTLVNTYAQISLLRSLSESQHEQLTQDLRKATTIIVTNLDPLTQMQRSILSRLQEISEFKGLLESMQQDFSRVLTEAIIEVKEQALDSLMQPLTQLQISYEAIQAGAREFVESAEKSMGSVTRLLQDLQHLPETSQAIRTEFENIIGLQREGYSLLTQNRSLIRNLECASVNMNDAAVAVEEALRSFADLPAVMQSEVAQSVKAELVGVFDAISPVLKQSVHAGLTEATKSLADASAEFKQTGASFQALPLALQKAVDDVLQDNLKNIFREVPEKLHEHLKIQLTSVQSGLEQTIMALTQSAQQFQSLPSQLHADTLKQVNLALEDSIKGLKQASQEFRQVPEAIQEMVQNATLPATSALAETSRSLIQSSDAFRNLPTQISQDLQNLLKQEIQDSTKGLMDAAQKFDKLPDYVSKTLSTATDEQIKLVAAAIGEQIEAYSDAMKTSQQEFSQIPQAWNHTLIETLRQTLQQYQEMIGGVKEVQSDYQLRMQHTAQLLADFAKTLDQQASTSKPDVLDPVV